MLAAAGLAGDHGIGRNMGDADRGLGLVDVLAAGAGGAIDVGAQVGGIDVDLDVVVDLGADEHRGERGMPAVVGIERRFAHQAVHADFGLQPAVGVIALDPEGGALDAGHVAAADFHQLGLPAAALAPAQVHAQQHLGPVLGFGAAGAGLDVDEAVGGVELAGEHALELELLDPGRDLFDILDHRLGGALVIVRLGHVQQFGRLDQAIGIGADLGDGLFQQRTFLAQRLGAVRVVPDGRVFQLAGYFFEAFDLGIEVKDTP